MGGSRDQNHTNSNVISRRFLGWLRRHVGGSPLVGGVWNHGLYRARARVRGTWSDGWFARSGRAWRGGTNCRSNSRTHINALRTGGCRPVCDHRRVAFRNRRPARGCQQCSCDDRARRGFSAGLQAVYGLVCGGRVLKFMPYQVVTGYLWSVGLIIVLGQLPKFLGLPNGVSLWQGLISPGLWKWQGVIVGVVTISAMLWAPKITRRLPAPILGLLGGVLSYFALSLVSPELLDLHNNSLVIGPLQADASLFDAVTSQVSALGTVNFSTLKLIAVPALTLSVLLSIDTLKTCVAVDALTRTRHNSDRELIGQGCGNLASFFLGGMPGSFWGECRGPARWARH